MNNHIPKQRQIESFYIENKINYKAVCNFIGLRRIDVSLATGVPVDNIRFDRAGNEEMRKFCYRLLNLIELVQEFFKDEVKTKLWFTLENLNFGGASPRDLIIAGKLSKLESFIYTQSENLK